MVLIFIAFCDSEAVERPAEINIITMTYLIVDLLFLAAEIIRKRLDNIPHPMREELDWANIGHHFIGAICLYAFVVNRVLRVNSLFYAATEISTIPLHISWIIKRRLDEPEPITVGKRRALQMALLVSGGLTWLSFLFFRFMGSYLMAAWLLYHASYIRHYNALQLRYDSL